MKGVECYEFFGGIAHKNQALHLYCHGIYRFQVLVMLRIFLSMYQVNYLFLSLNKGNITALALLDFSSAFDTIDHSILVHRHHTDIGFTDTVL